MSSIPPRLSVVSMGVHDVGSTAAFFTALGSPVSRLSNDTVTWFLTADSAVGLYPLADLAAEAGAPALVPLVPFAVDLPSPEAVTDAVEEALRAGATLLRPPTTEPWGGVAGYVRIPGGYVWEFTYNPAVRFGSDGRTLFP